MTEQNSIFGMVCAGFGLTKYKTHIYLISWIYNFEVATAAIASVEASEKTWVFLLVALIRDAGM